MAALAPEAAAAEGTAARGASARARPGSSAEPVITGPRTKRTHNPPRAQADADAEEFRRLDAEGGAMEDRATEKKSIAARKKARGRGGDVGAGNSRRGPSGLGRRATGWSTGDVSGGLLALILYGPVLAWIRGGKPLATAWFKAKFLNETAATPAAAKTPLTPQSPGQSTTEGPLGQSLGGLIGGAVGAANPGSTTVTSGSGGTTITTTGGVA